MATTNAQAGPSTFRHRNPSPKNETPSPINPVDEAEERAAGVGNGAGAGISRNGLSVDENGEVTKVPAFLTKLFSMVSDPGTNELIYWSPNGDSFFIPNQEQLAKKILPRFFKHSNFQSFVRQLNMYAFHKVPHNSATPTGESELWEFINPLFKRDQPELLGRITRRQRVGGLPGTSGQPFGSTGPASGSSRNSTRSANSTTQVVSPGGSFHPIHLITDGTTLGDDHLPTQSGNGNNMVIGPQGMLDLSAITSGIAAIQRTQASIGADLKALQASNEHLWREAIEQREKHKKHQETIDLIVSFLERLFGTDGEGLKGLKEAMRRTGLARPTSAQGGEGEEGEGGSGRKKRRLGVERMIEDGKGGEGKVVEISDKKSRYTDPFLPRPTRTRSDPSWTDSDDISARFQTIPSEGEPSPGTNRANTPNPPNTRSGTGQGMTGNVDGSGYDPLALALAPYYPNGPGSNQNHDENQNNGNGAGNGVGVGSNYFNSTNPNYAGFDFTNNDNPINTYLPPQTQNTSNSTATANGIGPYNLDPSLLQTTIGSLLQSPAAAQMFLNSLKQSAQAQSLSYPAPAPNFNSGPNTGQNWNQTQQGLGQGQGQGQSQNQGLNFGTSIYSSDPTLALFNPLPNSPGPGMGPLLEDNQAALLRSYENALGVNQGVEELQRGVDELVRSMGLDVGGGALPQQGQGQGQGQGIGEPENMDDIFRSGGGVGVKREEGEGEGLDLDDGFDVDQFLKSLQDDQAGGVGEGM